MIKGWLEEYKTGKCSRKIWQAISFYENVVNDNQDYYQRGERGQLITCNVQVEDEIINLYINKGQEVDVYLLTNVFQLLAGRMFENYDKDALLQ